MIVARIEVNMSKIYSHLKEMRKQTDADTYAISFSAMLPERVASAGSVVGLIKNAAERICIL